MARRVFKMAKSQITGVIRESGETIEQKMERVVHSGEGVTEGAPRIYTERKDGVNPAYDIRTDRWEVATDAMDSVAKSYKAKRESQYKEITKDDIIKNDDLKSDGNVGEAKAE